MAENDPSKLAALIEYSEKYQDDSYEYRCVSCNGVSPLRAAALPLFPRAAGLACGRGARTAALFAHRRTPHTVPVLL